MPAKNRLDMYTDIQYTCNLCAPTHVVKRQPIEEEKKKAYAMQLRTRTLIKDRSIRKYGASIDHKRTYSSPERMR